MTPDLRAQKANEALRSSPLLNCLTDAQYEHLADKVRLKRCDRGGPIWINGADVDFFGLVEEGFVKIVRSNPTGIEMTMEIMGPGQTFGLLGVLAGTGCPLMAYGLTQTTYLQIPKDAFAEVYDANHELKDRLLRKTAKRMHQKLDFISKLSTGKAEVRLAALLFVLAESYGHEVGDSIRLDVPLTRQAIGEMAGMTTETTIRVLSAWTQMKLVSTDQQRITMLDPSALEQFLH